MPDHDPSSATLADVRQLAGLLDAAPVAVYAKGRDGRYLYVNRWFGRLMGVHPRVDPVGRGDGELFGAAVAVALRSRDLATLAADGPTGADEAVTEALALHHGQRAMVFARRALRDEAGAVVGTFGTVTDVTADVEAERYDTRFRTLFARSPIGMMILAPDGRWLRVNEAFADRVGYPEAALVGSRVARLLHPQDAGAIERLIRAAREASPLPASLEVRFVSSQDGVVHLSLTGTSLGDPSALGHVVLVHAVDLTALRRAEGMLAEARQRGEAAAERPVAVVVDDEMVATSAISRVLDDLGFDVLSTEDARVALRYCQSRRPALMVTDLLMPLMAGEELISRARAFVPELRVVCVSGFPPSRLPKGDPNLSWLPKPFDAGALASEVERLLPEVARRPAPAPSKDAVLR